jgi:hypothetical protein
LIHCPYILYIIVDPRFGRAAAAGIGHNRQILYCGRLSSVKMPEVLYTSAMETTRNSCQKDRINKGIKSRKKSKKGVDKRV